MSQQFSAPEGRSTARALLTWGVLLFAAPVVVSTALRFRFDGADGARLPASHAQQNTEQWAASAFAQRPTLRVSWIGGTLNDLRTAQFSEELLGRSGPDGVRRGGSPFVADVAPAAEWFSAMVSNGVSPEDAAQRLDGWVLGRGGVKVKFTDDACGRFDESLARLEQQLAAELGVAVVVRPRPMITVTVLEGDAVTDESEPADEPAEAGEPTQTLPPAKDGALPLAAPTFAEFDAEILCEAETPELRARIRSLALAVTGPPTASAPNGAPLVAESFDAVGSPAAIDVRLSEGGVANPQAALDAIRQAALQVGVPPSELHVSGEVLEAARRADSLRRIVWSGAVGTPWTQRSALLIWCGALAVVVLLTARMSADSALTILAGTAAMALTAACLNVFGARWTTTMLAILPGVFAATAAAAAQRLSRTGDVPGPQDAARVATAAAPARVVGWPPLVVALASCGLFAACPAPEARGAAMVGLVGALCGGLMALYAAPAVQHLFLRRRRDESLTESFAALGHCLTSAPVWSTAAAVLLLATTAGVMEWTRPAQRSGRTTAEAGDDAHPPRALGAGIGGGDALMACVSFSADVQQQLRFAERLEIVRQATDRLRKNAFVEGAVSLADFHPAAPQLPENARIRERTAYNRKLREFEQRIQKEQADWTAGWVARVSSSNESAATGWAAAGDEIWRIASSTRVADRFRAIEVLASLNASLQAGTRFHAGVDHRVVGAAPTAAVLQGLWAPWRLLAAAVLAVHLLLAAIILGHTRWLMLGLLSGLPLLQLLASAALRQAPCDSSALIAATLGAGLALSVLLEMTQTFQVHYARTVDRAYSVGAAAQSVLRVWWPLLSGGLLAAVLLATLPGAGRGLESWASELVRALLTATLQATVVAPMLLAGWCGRWAAGASDRLALPPDVLHPDGVYPIAPLESGPSLRTDEGESPSGPHVAPYVERDEARRRTRHAG